MSMLSAQCDELRAMAGSVGLAMPQAATLMMGAADSIDRLDAENVKLRELLSESFLLMHHGGLTTGAYGRCMELFMDAQTLGIEIPFMHEMEDE